MAIPGGSDSENTNDETGSREDPPSLLGAPMPGEDPASKPLASSLGQAARSFESKFAARRKKRLEETAAALKEPSGSPDITEPAEGSGYKPAPEQGSGTFSATRNADAGAGPVPLGGIDGEIGSDAGIDDNARRFLQKLSGRFPTDETLQEPEKSSTSQASSQGANKISNEDIDEESSSNSTTEPSSRSAASADPGWHKVSDSSAASASSSNSSPVNAPEPSDSGALGKEYDFTSAVRSLGKQPGKGDAEDSEQNQRSTLIENYSKKEKLAKTDDPEWDQKNTIIEKFKPGDLTKRDDSVQDQKSTIIEKFKQSDLTKRDDSVQDQKSTIIEKFKQSDLKKPGISGKAQPDLASSASSAPQASANSTAASSSPLDPPAQASAAPAAPTDISTTRAGFKPRKDLSSYRNFDTGRSGSSALSGPGGSADAKLFGGMSSAPEDLPSEEPQTPEERKKALDALGYKYGTELPSEVSGGPAPSAIPLKNDQFRPPTAPSPGIPGVSKAAASDVGWQSVPKEEKPKGGAFAAARKSQTLGPVELAAKKKDEDLRTVAPVEKPKPYRPRDEEANIPKNRWGQAPDTATARSVWADQLGITKPASTMRGPSASLRGRLKRVMSADIFNVRELYSLRGIAALIVFIAQAQIFAAHAKPGYPINMIGAQIFFVMSGFVITRWLMVNEAGSLQRTLGEFYARRALRIFPMYYLVLCVLMFTGHLTNAESFFCGLFNFSAFQSVKVAPQLVQYWTLCVEMQFYVLFPILLMITPQRFRMALVILLTGATVACTYMSAPHAQDWLLLPISGQYIMWGCLAGYMDVKSDVALSLNASLCVVLGVAAQAGLHTWLLAYSNVPTGDVSDLLWKGLSTVNAVSLAVLIFGLWRTSKAWLRGLCANDVLVYFGKISYGFYLLLPLCFFMQPSIIAVVPILAKVPAIVTSFVITFIMAVVTFHYLQTPINNVREHLPIAR
jgi:peptidoglycan/LPS O-acetylase OafA/YrhL